MKNFFRVMLAVTLSLAYLFMSANLVLAATEEQTEYDGNNAVGTGSETLVFEAIGQKLVISDRTVTKLGFWLQKAGTPNGVINFEIRQLDETVLATKYLMNCVDVSTNTTYYEVEFDTPVYIDEEVRIMVTSNNTGSYSNAVVVFYHITNVKADEGCTRLQDTTWDTNLLAIYDLAYIYSYQSLPSITTLPASNQTYNSLLGDWSIDFNCYIDDDGGDNVTVGWIMKELPDGEFGYIMNSLGTYATGSNITDTLPTGHGLLPGNSYTYYARATNESGYTDGNSVNFTMSEPEEAPTIVTYNYPLSTNATALTAKIYGGVIYDGSENITGYFYWREIGGEWELSSNTTGLRSGDTFNVTLTDLSLAEGYQYQAGGLNQFGEGLGGIGTFTIQTVAQPTVETLPATYITNTSVYLSGNVTDLGNDDSLECGFQYRVIGTHIWYDTAIVFQGVTGEYTVMLSSLTPQTNYEFRAIVLANVLGSSETFTDYGDILVFSTFGTYTVPVIITGNATYVSQGLVRLISTIYYDGGYSVNAYARYREKNTTTWSNTAISYGAVTDDVIWHLASDIKNNTIYEYQSVGINEAGNSTGSIRTFAVDTSGGITSDDVVEDDGVNAGTDILNNLKESLGLVGTFGSWALLFIILIAIALVYGIAIISVSGVAKQAVAVAWILSSIAVVGGFLFTGELGVWTIIIATGSVIAIIIIFVSVKLTGGGNQI